MRRHQEVFIDCGFLLREAANRFALKSWLEGIDSWWLHEERSEYGNFLTNLQQKLKRPVVSDEGASAFNEDISSAIRGNITLNRDVSNCVGSISVSGTGKQFAHIARFRLVSEPLKFGSFKNCEIEECIIAGSNTDFSFQNCRIKILRIFGCKSVDISNCIIGEIAFQGGGQIKSFVCKTTYIKYITNNIDDIFYGQIELENVIFDRTRNEDDEFFRQKGLRISSPQDYRNTRLNLIQKGNLRAAGIFQYVEFSLERKRRPFSSLFFIDYIYEKISDYGNSITKELATLAINLFITTFILYITNTAIVNPKNFPTAGWQIFLNHQGFWSSVVKQIILQSEFIRNPFSFQETQLLVISRNFFLSVFLFFDTIFVYILSFLIISTVRKYFRIS